MGWLSGWWLRQDLTAEVEKVIDRKMRETVSALNSVDTLTKKKLDLESALDRLQRDHDQLSQDIERERLDVKYKLGLEKMRQEQEARIAQERLQAQRDQIEAEKAVAVREARLAAKEEATEEARSQMTAFQDRQERMIESLIDALPTAKIMHKSGHAD